MMVFNSHTINRQSLFFLSSVIFVLASCLFVYWPGISGIFLVDDYPNLAPLANNGGVTDLNTFLAFVFGNHSGPTGRPVSMLSFLLNDQYWPGSPESFKYTNLMIHVLCGMLIIWLSYRLTLAIANNNNFAILVSVFTGAFWMMHPFNVSTTLYVIQRMAQLATLFSLAGILCYCYGRLIFKDNRNKALLIMSSGVAVFGLLSVFSKENGILMVLFILIIESTLFSHLDKPKELKYWFWIFVYTPLAILFLYFASKGFYVNGFHDREFTQAQRLLTENRILLDYLNSIFIPQLRGNGLINDDIEISTGIFTPITTILAIIINLTLLVIAIRYRKRHPVLSFSILWFYGGHILESTFTSLELYFEHRNYMPMIGPIFGVMYYLPKFAELAEKQSIKRLIVTIPVVLIIFAGILTHQSATIWSSPGALFKVWAMEHPDSLRAQRIYGQYLGINNQPEQAIQTIDATFRKFPHDISLPLEIINIGCHYKLEVQYTIKDIEGMIPSARFTDGILTMTTTLVDSIVKEKCSNYDVYDAISLITAIGEIPNIQRHGKTYAKLLYLQSDLHVLVGQLSPAIELLNTVYKHQPLPTAPLRQATLLASAGLYDDALEYIEKAKKAAKNTKFLTPSELPKIIEYEVKIRNMAKIDEEMHKNGV
jgi:hypothetical protein